VTQEGRSYPGFNLFDADDDALFQTILRGEFHLSGLQNKSLRRFLPHLNSGRFRASKRLRESGNGSKSGSWSTTTRPAAVIGVDLPLSSPL
jgi:hypothetical protein